MLVQALRALLYGFGSVLLGASLAAAGLSDLEVGLVLTAMLTGFALATVAVGAVGDRLGRRRTYRGLFLAMAAAGAVFALTDWLPALLLAALTGTVSVEVSESGPLTSVEQAMIAQAAPTPEERNRAFARYNAVAYLAGSVGTLLAGGPDLFRAYVSALPANQRFLLAYPAVALACAWLAGRLSPAVEAGGPGGRRLPLVRSRQRVAGLAALFAVDSLGGGFVVQSFLVFWFRRRFGAPTELTAALLFGAGLLQGASSLAAGRLASRIGLLNTMVFTHLPSNALLALVPLAPSFPLAAATLLARFAISQMDVPARQAYVVAIVDPEERTAAAAWTNAARYVARPAGPALGGWLMAAAGLGAPFVAAGALKAAYDLTLFAAFRRMVPHPAPEGGRPGGGPPGGGSAEGQPA